MKGRPILLNSPGPVADAFLHCPAFVSVCIGPVGSGKTLTGLQKGLLLGARQHGVKDHRGIMRRTARFGVIRESYPNIEANILPSWFKIVPESAGKFSWKAPFTHSFSKVLRRDEDGQPVDILDMQYEFRAIGDRTVEEIMRGWEVNGFLVDEGDLQPEELISYGSGRVGRFSALDPKLVVDPQIVITSNMPYIGNWLHSFAVLGQLEKSVDPALLAALKGRKLLACHIQPGGRDDDAENVHNLPDGYYTIQAALNEHKPGYVERMIDNLSVPMQHGQPVYAKFRHHKHIAAKPLEWDRARKVILGLDQGLNAAAVAMQRTETGQIRVLREVVIFKGDGKTLDSVGPTMFGRMVRQMLDDHFPGITQDDIRVVADPAAFASADRADHEHDWVKAVEAQIKLRIHRAKSNSPVQRLEPIRKKQMEDGGYLVSPACPVLIAGHLGGYHYAKGFIGAGAARESRGHVEVADTIYTHVCDGEQYAGMEGDGVIADVFGKARRTRRPVRVNYGDGYFSGRRAVA